MLCLAYRDSLKASDTQGLSIVADPSRSAKIRSLPDDVYGLGFSQVVERSRSGSAENSFTNALDLEYLNLVADLHWLPEPTSSLNRSQIRIGRTRPSAFRCDGLHPPSPTT